jgi:hypothetical protein
MSLTNLSKIAGSLTNIAKTAASLANEAINIFTSYLLQETGDYLLQENGDKLILEESGNNISNLGKTAA